jgi:hypothetical protein
VIVVDEQLDRRQVIAAFSTWYRGSVLPITALRPNTVIKDEAIPALLRLARQPTFVTINVQDFWRVTEPHQRYCIVAVEVPSVRINEVPNLVRSLLRLPEFATKASRMGKVVRVSTRAIEYYGADTRVLSLLRTGA